MRIKLPLWGRIVTNHRLRKLDKWVEAFKGRFPAEHADKSHSNYKIGCSRDLVEGARCQE